ncbi:leucyl aminopeptidase family protein [Lysobacter gummosus]|uniref:Leucyl aminopeptidase family protein n=1 Tax=Lysobacter gummosus TaxID=262324 RepID=A0ABY3XA17_9GAMM|nr:leucyl aminopeptidase family protein [Lysobacter gummosus]ALN93346.1 cytosol aminopeptidase [Lysobacter gummosus]UNP28825.1 leucyl aminopeptidase family protein [Lysobacter gummosus]
MTLPLGFTSSDADALPLALVGRVGFNAWRDALTPAAAAWAQAQGFDGSAGSVLVLPGEHGELAGAALGIGDALDPYSYGHAPFALPARSWRLQGEHDAAIRDALRLGWGLGSYRFSRYKTPSRAPALLHTDAAADDEVFALLAASVRVRDLVNTPTEHMGPDELEAVSREIAQRFGADIEVIAGDALIAQNFPAIHAVGRASHRAPRLIALRWGDESHPHIAIVGKGVCFDTGGLDLKPADGMRWMKKDMGGAAHAIALAELIMARKLPLRITMLVPAVENAVGPDAFRPGEVIATRQGISVEIDNTDAEGRVILCDALTYAGEQSPELLLDFATLTGAARIALGPDLPALYSNQDEIANQWLDAGAHQRDQVWRMPLWRPYLRYLTSHIADIANGGPSKMAGSVTAALYLERFVPADLAWAHLDVYSWNDADRPGRPAGGEAQGLRAVYAMLKARAAA